IAGKTLTHGTPRKLKLRSKIRTLQRKLLSVKSNNTHEITEEDVTTFMEKNYPSIENFVKMQMHLTKVAPKRARYTTEFKQLALMIYFLGPKVYKFLRKTLQLPSKSTLLRITRKWEINPGFKDFIFSAIQIRVNTLGTLARDCVLCLDEMSLKTFLFYNISQDSIVGYHHSISGKSYDAANNDLVVMARGINSNWKQPIAYFFLNSICSVDDLIKIIFSVTTKLQNIGLNVLSVVSDQGTNFMKLSKQLNVTPEKPDFFINDKKVFSLFDVPHLLKSTRNNFFAHHFDFSEGRTNKAFLERFYEKDKQQKYRLAPKLTDIHIHPNSFQEMKVKYASQVFSATVAAGLNCYISLGQLPNEAMATATFVKLVDTLFDIPNSWKFGGSKFSNRPFMGSSYQIEVDKKGIQLLNT
ncbi:hypothetical protein ILUMI_15279, partial [Ignelater luminosus]